MTRGEEPALTAGQRRTVVAGLMLAISLAAVDLLIIATAVPDIAGDLGHLGQTAWVFTAYLLGSTATMPLWGKLGDLYGRKRVLQAACVVFMSASALAGASQSMEMLIAARFLQGLGGGGLQALPAGIIGDIAPPRQRGKYLAAVTSVWAAAAMLGPVIGGGFVDTVGWRWVFYLNLPLGMLALVLVSGALRVREQRRRASLDLAGSGLLVIATGAAVVATSTGGKQIGWLSAPMVALVVMAAGAGVAFVAWERRTPEPLVRLSMFREPVVRSGAITTFWFGMANFGTAIIIPLYARVVTGLDATAAGLALAPVSVGIFCSTFVVGRLIARTGRYRLYPPVGAAVFAVGLVWFALLDADSPWYLLFVVSFVAGLGNGAIGVVITISIQNVVPYREMGAATATAVFSRSLGQTLGSAVLGAVLAARLDHHLLALVPTTELDPEQLRSSPDTIAGFGPEVRGAVVEAFHRSFDDVLVVMVAFTLISLLAGLTIRNVALRDTVGDDGPVEGAAQRRSARKG